MPRSGRGRTRRPESDAARPRRDLVDVAVGHEVGVGEEEDDLGLQRQRRAEGRHVVGAAVGDDSA